MGAPKSIFGICHSLNLSTYNIKEEKKGKKVFKNIRRRLVCLCVGPALVQVLKSANRKLYMLRVLRKCALPTSDLLTCV